MQKKYRILLAVLLLPALVSFMQDWVTFTYEDQGFSLKFPGKPEENSQQVTTDAGEVTMHIFSYEAKIGGDDIVYMAMASEFPESSGINSDNKKKLDVQYRNAIDGGVKNVKGTLVSEENTKIKGYEGRKFKITYDDGAGFIAGKVFLVKRRMYIVQTVASKQNENDPSNERFVNSFKLIQ